MCPSACAGPLHSPPLQVQKGYDFGLKTYICPKPDATNNGSPAAAPSASGATGTPTDTAAQPLTIELDVTGVCGAAVATPAAAFHAAQGATHLHLTTQPSTPPAGTTAADFQSKLAEPFCAQLLRLTGDSSATCTVVHVAAVSGRRLLQVRRGRGWLQLWGVPAHLLPAPCLLNHCLPPNLPPPPSKNNRTRST